MAQPIPYQIFLSDASAARFQPLERIISHDDFDCGLQGWTELIGNYETDLQTLLPGFRDCRPPMLSNATMWDTGTAGSQSGTYSMKLATRAKAGHHAVALKRLTFRELSRVQVEAFFTFKPEAAAASLKQKDLQSFGVFFDIQDETRRLMPHFRYHNASDGTLRQSWQYRAGAQPRVQVGTSGEMASTFHLDREGWQDVPDSHQPLCYNEIVTKQNWHYLRMLVDLDGGRATELQCNDRVFDVSGLPTLWQDRERTLAQMLNVAFFVESNTATRSFLFLDSVMLSGDSRASS